MWKTKFRFATWSESNRIAEDMKRRDFIKTGIVASGATLLCGIEEASSGVRPQQEKNSEEGQGHQKNVLMIISDDHGIDQLGCYGNSMIQTPHLDTMARKGVRFTNAFAVAASCSASRGSILSGLYPHQNGQFGHEHNWHHFSLFDRVETLPSILKKNGYRTGLIGKLHVGSRNNLAFDFRPDQKGLMGNRDVRRMSELAAEFFGQERDRPFFLLVGYSDPHREDQGASTMKNVENFSGFANGKTYRDITPVKYKPEAVRVPDYLPDIPEVREELADQYEAVSRLDTGIGWVLESLKQAGRDRDTLVVYLSDNGIPFPGAKTTVYDSGTHVPLIISSPDLKQGGTVNASIVGLTDLMPTILEWAGVGLPPYALPGRSFLNILGAADDPGRTEVFASHTFHEVTMFYPMRSVRTRRYRYIFNLYPELEFPFATDLFVSRTWQGILQRKLDTMGKRSTRGYVFRPREELYDVEEDPAESINLANDSKHAEILKELREALARMRAETDDPWLINDHYAINRMTFGRP